MRRLIFLGAVALVACQQNVAGNSARLIGAHDVALVGDLLFVTSSDRNELRVLELAPANRPANSRLFKQAPNPLEALSIPVTERPSRLVRDLGYADLRDEKDQLVTARGVETAGPWVYASRSGGSEISIVAAHPDQLVEVKRVVTASPLTATWAVDDPKKKESRLYFATFDGSSSRLHKLALSQDLATLDAMTVAQLSAGQVVLGGFANEVVSDVIAIPGLEKRRVGGNALCVDPETDCLVVATRTAKGSSGRVLLFDPKTNQTAPLSFPGPVRLLATHAAVNDVGAGQRVFGILDEEACGSSSCAGVIAVDTLDGKIANDRFGQPMLSIKVGDTLPTGLSLSTKSFLNTPGNYDQGGGDPGPREFSVVGVISNSNGDVQFFDAWNLTPIDFNPAKANSAGVTLFSPLPDGGNEPLDGGGPTPQVIHDGGTYLRKVPLKDGGADVFDSQGNQVFVEVDDFPLKVGDGTFQNEQVRFISHGRVSGLVGLPLEPADHTARVLRFPPALTDRVLAGDIAELGSCRAGIIAVDAGVAQFDATCAASPTWSLRANAAGSDFTVVGVQRGYLGRTGPGKTFTYTGPIFERRAGQTPSLIVPMGEKTLPEDHYWELSIASNFAPFIVSIDNNGVGCVANVAASVVYDRKRQTVFASYPSADAVIEIFATQVGRGLTSRNAICYR